MFPVVQKDSWRACGSNIGAAKPPEPTAAHSRRYRRVGAYGLAGRDSHIEAEVDDVALLHHVVFALAAEEAG